MQYRKRCHAGFIEISAASAGLSLVRMNEKQSSLFLELLALKIEDVKARVRSSLKVLNKQTSAGKSNKTLIILSHPAHVPYDGRSHGKLCEA